MAEVEGLTEMIFRVLHVSPPPPPRMTNEGSLRIETTGEFANFVEDSTSRSSLRVAPKEGTVSSITEVTQTKSFAANTAGEFVVRSKKRFNKRFLISITIGQNNFKSHCRDISVGGINLEEPLPKWVHGQFKVRINKPTSKQAVELTCMVIQSQQPDDRHRILILPLQSEVDEKNLEHWIAA